MSSIVPLLNGKYFHLYNKGIDGITLFHKKEDFNYFLKKYNKYIPLIAETFSYCLMNNHFHFLIKIKESEKIPLISNKKRYDPSRQFSHLFNAYSKWFNYKYGRKGPLLERPFKRKLIESEIYFKDLVVYIHTNPLHHGITMDYSGYVWSSFRTFVKGNTNIISLSDTVSWFGNSKDFREYHEFRKEKILIEDDL